MNKSHSVLFTLLITVFIMAGCDQKYVDDISIAPVPGASGGGNFSPGYYVSETTGSDANSGLSPVNALKTIAAAYNKVVAGDTVFIMNGNYSNGGNVLLTITKSGTADKYITFKAYPTHTPKIFISGNVYNGITINGNYIIIDGLDMQGDNANITLAAATTSYNNALNGIANPNQGMYNTNAITIGGPRTESRLPHHITIRNCKIHDFPGGGLNAIQSDYTIFENNIVYNNAWYMMYGGSGISILNPVNTDAGDIAKYKNIIRNNIVYGNKTQVPWIGITPPRLSDGNGIIVDVNQYPYDQPTQTANAYKGRTLVENNVSFNNGGSGIHAYKADHVDIINNTAYGNGVIMNYADIFAGSATDVKILNNIMYSKAGGRCNSAPASGTNVVYDYNIYFNGTVAVQGPHDKIANPGFVNPSIDGAVANFALSSSASPAANAGTQAIFSAKDILGVTRPKGGAVDCGAYESY
ncbi:MAG: right-handed parallel beta-helix repeat-containing protein [Chitinophagaceae bacterium]|nr:right-handed parallel beta-helix repeat-containing protein [Chitinophagaceae bacterium]